jgi:DNA-binding HxlR family transcriptional regulator
MPMSTKPPPDELRLGIVAREILATLGDRWSALVIYVLFDGPLRFGELKERIDVIGPPRLRSGEISHKVLAESLRGLRRDGFIERSEGDQAAARYSLTPLGQSFRAPLMAVHDWTSIHLAEIEAARQRFDSSTSS